MKAYSEIDSPYDAVRRFGGVRRLYGEAALDRLLVGRVCVVGIGGVGSWAAEALARSGVGHLGLIDLDHVAESNINRQVHALDPTLGQAKVEAMRQRIAQINPRCQLIAIDSFVEPDNATMLLNDFDVVIDAVDSVRAKVAIILACSASATPVIVVGGAGGKTDPTQIKVADLADTSQDPLLAKLRRSLRAEHGFSRVQGRRFDIEAVYSLEPVFLPWREEGSKQGLQGLACAGYGSSVMVTASFGFFAASRAVTALLGRNAGREKKERA